MARRIARASLILLTLLLVGCDHVTKQAAATLLSARRPVELIPGIIDLRYTENHDTAFSLLGRFGAEGLRPWLALSAALVLVLLVGLWARRRHEASRLEHIGFAVALAGAIGNVADRVFRGYVVDFIHVQHWPVFNVADVVIAVGAGLIMLASFRQKTQSPHTG